MRKFIFLVAYVALPIVPAALYVAASGGGMGAYPGSVALGAYAFALLCSQLALAARPAFAVGALGLKGLTALHAATPLLALLLALGHRMLKSISGFSLDSGQAILGLAAFLTLAAASILAAFLLANWKGSAGAAAKRLRAKADASLGFGYKKARAVHAITALAIAALAVHVALASSSAPSFNPAGSAVLAAWFALAEILYIRYRLRGRPIPAAKAKATAKPPVKEGEGR